jgi:radical SAM protein with 4Fe4S-binding SPASM domain
MIQKNNLKRFLGKGLMQPAYAFTVFAKRLRGYLYYLYGSGKSGYPESITLFLTYRCNLRCKMCGQWGARGVTKRYGPNEVNKELELSVLYGLIDDVAPFKPNITLFGGEPLLYPGCTGLIKRIKERGMHCLMITNGSLIGRSAEDILESGLDELNVSLDGNAALHDKIRGSAGLFDTIMRGLAKLKDLKANAGRKKPLLNLQCTITKYNYLYLDELLEVAAESGADSLTFHNLVFIDHELLLKQRKCDDILGCKSTGWEGFVFDPGIDAGVLNEKIRKISEGKYGFKTDFYPAFSGKSLLEYYADPSCVPSGYANRCLSPWMTAYILPDGEMRPCLNLTYSYGNIASSGFKELWNNEKAITFRKELKGQRTFPACARCTELYRY